MTQNSKKNERKELIKQNRDSKIQNELINSDCYSTVSKLYDFVFKKVCCVNFLDRNATIIM